MWTLIAAVKKDFLQNTSNKVFHCLTESEIVRNVSQCSNQRFLLVAIEVLVSPVPTAMQVLCHSIISTGTISSLLVLYDLYRYNIISTGIVSCWEQCRLCISLFSCHACHGLISCPTAMQVECFFFFFQKYIVQLNPLYHLYRYNIISTGIVSCQQQCRLHVFLVFFQYSIVYIYIYSIL